MKSTQPKTLFAAGAALLLLGLALFAGQEDPSPLAPASPTPERAEAPTQAPTPASAPHAKAQASLAKRVQTLGKQSNARGSIEVATIDVGGIPTKVAADHVTARVRGDLSALEPWLRQQGSRILGQSPWTGRVRLAIPPGSSLVKMRDALEAHPAIADVHHDPLVFGAGKKPKKSNRGQMGHAVFDSATEIIQLGADLMGYQWHLRATRVPQMWDNHNPTSLPECVTALEARAQFVHSPASTSSQNMDAQYQRCLDAQGPLLRDDIVQVAILDTGAATRDFGQGQTQHLQSPALRGVSVQGEYDFINDDDMALDDNQHGTHMTNVAMGLGRTTGIAMGAQLMPVKVLDNQKVGTESALIDGLYFAATQGADVINMSLSFPRHYVPSLAMEEAILYTVNKGAVMVAAAGNDGEDYVAFPAAFPDVIAVGASAMEDTTQFPLRAPYSNYSAALDILAPGGRLDMDADYDGLPDGILSQSFAWQDPSDHGYWLLAGTSPAAAQVSGVVASLLQAGADPKNVRWLLQAHADALMPNDKFTREEGAGVLNAEATLAAVHNDPGPDTTYFVNTVVFWQDMGGEGSRGRAYVEVVDAQNQPVDVTVHVEWLGDVQSHRGCDTGNRGQCRVVSPPTLDGVVIGARVLGVEDSQGMIHRPTPFHRFDKLSYELIATMAPAQARNVAIVYDESVLEPLQDGTLQPTVNLKNIGTGLASSSMVLALKQNYFETSSIAPMYLSLRSFGTGLASSSIVLDRNFFNPSILADYTSTDLIVRSYPIGTGLASSSALWLGDLSFGFASLNVGYNPGVLYFNNGTGLASSSFVLDLSLWNPNLFTPTPDLGQTLQGYGTGLASSSFVLNLNLDTGLWLGWTPDFIHSLGTGLASSSFVLKPTYETQNLALQTVSMPAYSLQLATLRGLGEQALRHDVAPP